MRSYNFVPVWQIFTALGLGYLFYKLRKLKLWILSLFLLVTLFSLFTLFKNYFNNFPKEQSKSFQYGLTQAIPYVFSRQNDYNHIVLSNKDNLYQSYMFFLFHTKYDPEKYLKQGGTLSGGFAATHKIGKYEFRPINWNSEVKKEKTLYVGNPTDFPKDIQSVTEFKNLDGNVVVVITET